MSEQYIPLIAADDVPDGEMRAVKANGRSVVVCQIKGEYHAFEDACSHARATLSDGRLHGCEVVCPLHQARFDVRDGACLSPPASRAIDTFATRLSEGRVEALVPEKVKAKPQFGPMF